jgi:CubicO group peptidase (beta-lactamase class C family)
MMKKYLFVLLMISNFYSFGQNSIHKKIDSLLARQVESKLSPGLTVGVVKDGKLIYHNSNGLMNLEYNIPFNDSTVFGVASITKQFTAACIAILAKQGKLSVNDDVRKFIPELNFFGDTIRIKHLLNHTSGIRNHNVLLDLFGFDYQHQGYTNKMIQELMFRQKGINNQPGDKMLYSNTNYVLLALLVERVSGMKIHQFAKKELFEPLKMINTFYASDLKNVIKNRAYPYYKEKNTFKQPKSLTLCVGAGGLGTTISDLALWSQIFLSNKHPFSFIADFVTKLEPLNNGELMKHARGMFVTTYKGYNTLNHSGRDLGMRSQFICIPDLNIGVIVFANSEHINAVDVSYKILDLWIEEFPQNEKTQKAYQHKKEDLNTFVGDYQELNSDLRMHLFIDNDTLNVQSSFGRHPVQLSSNSKNSFARLNNASVTYSFLSDKKSEADLLIDFGGAIFYFEKIELVKTPNQNISEYSGTYFSEELNVSYEISVANKKLILNYPNNEGLVLKEGEKDVFGSNRRTKYTFMRDNTNQILSFNVAAEGTVKDIVFKKMN